MFLYTLPLSLSLSLSRGSISRQGTEGRRKKGKEGETEEKGMYQNG